MTASTTTTTTTGPLCTLGFFLLFPRLFFRFLLDRPQAASLFEPNLTCIILRRLICFTVLAAVRRHVVIGTIFR